jgi:D-3-phosphoglycerate dehydrogenase / 2-oxoglutarate reductase
MKPASSTGRVLVTTVPFGEPDPRPLQLLQQAGLDLSTNPLGRPLHEAELAELVGPYEVLVAGGADPVTEAVLARAPHLRLVARTGIGLDSIDLIAARRRGIAVTYTPDAPAPAVAELVIGQILALLRHTPRADRGLRAGRWKRHVGRRLSELTVGIIGVGRIGRRVLGHLQGFGPPRVLLDDLVPDAALAERFGATWTDKQTIWSQADVITLHVPLTPATGRLVGRRELDRLRPGAVLINTSRGGVLDEAALAAALRARPDLSAALDVFEHEPYSGELTALENVLLSCHMGSCTADCRLGMELGAAEEVVRYFRGEPFASAVPDEEYALQSLGRS